MKQPTVSVLLPVYNTERYVDQAVRSILAQTLGDFELILIDDGSTDRSLEILRRHERRDRRIRLISRPNTGLIGALNEGLSIARGELIARMDSDDIALPDRLERQVAFLQAHPEVVCVGGCFEMMDGAGRRLTCLRPPPDNQTIQKLLLAGQAAICHPAATMRRAAVERAGGYDPQFRHVEDLDLFLKLGEVGELRNLPEVVLRYRLHAGSVSERVGMEQRERGRLACEQAWARRGITDGCYEATDAWRPGNDRRSQHDFCLQYGWWAFGSGERRTAMIYGLKAIARMPLATDGWKLLGCAAIKPRRAGNHV